MAEGARLLSGYRVHSPIGGSNPLLSSELKAPPARGLQRFAGRGGVASLRARARRRGEPDSPLPVDRSSGNAAEHRLVGDFRPFLWDVGGSHETAVASGPGRGLG